MEILAAAFFIILILAIALLYSTVSWGLVMWKFWYWFLLPVFPALPQINFVQAVGLICFLSLFKTVESQFIKKEYKDETASVWSPIVATWLTLFFGWLVWLVIN